jgi:hypothetical protein
MPRVKILFAALTLTAWCQSSQAQPNAVTVAFRNELKGVAFAAVLEQLDANGVVVNVTTQGIGVNGIGTTAVLPGTFYNVRILPSDGGGFVFTNRDLAKEFSDNGNNPLEFEGRFDARGKRIAVIMHIGKKTISAPRMEYPGMDYNSYYAAQQYSETCSSCEYHRFSIFHRWRR